MNIKSLVAILVGILFLACIISSLGTVDAGNRGVVTRMGAVTGVIKQEGFYTKAPFVEKVVEMSVRVIKEQVEVEGASKDLQTVKSIVALNLSLEPSKCAEVYQVFGLNYLETIVAPAMQESCKAIFAQYTAEELISKREAVKAGVFKAIADKMNPMGIKTEALNIVDFDFSQSFNQAIEAKVTAEQNALAAKNMLAQKEYEAQQLVATAKGKAEAMQVESLALAKNPQVLQLRALEKWNGILPQVVGSQAIPFIETKLEK